MRCSGPRGLDLGSGPLPAALQTGAQAEVRLLSSAGCQRSLFNRLWFAGLNYFKIINFSQRKQVGWGVEEEM